MLLPALELLEGAQVRVAVVEVGNQAQVDLVVFRVVEEGATAGAVFLQRPAHTVYHQARLVLLGGNLPDFLDADAVVLRVLALVQAELADQFLAQVAAAALGEEGVFRVQLHAGGVAVLLFPVGADAHVAGGDALDAAVLVVEHFGGGKARVDLNAEVLRLLCQPAAQVAHGDNVVAFVVGGLGNQEIGQGDGLAAAGVEQELVLADRGGQGRAQGLPVREQFVQSPRLEDRP